MQQMLKVRMEYKAVFPNGNIISVDPHNKEDVYDFFHLYICDRTVKLYVVWNDGSENEITLI